MIVPGGSIRGYLATIGRPVKRRMRLTRLRYVLGSKNVCRASVIRRLAHADAPFTQGLCYSDGYLIESTGLPTGSSLRKLNVDDGRVMVSVRLENLWAEGCAGIGNVIVQLTWRDEIALTYDRDTLELLAQHDYPREGWGLTSDGARLWTTDGSSNLFRLDESMAVEEMRTVHLGHRPLSGLNDIEWVDGLILANVLFDDCIYAISTETREVVGAIDCSELEPRTRRQSYENVLNGVAYAGDRGTLFVTGKRWEWIYEISLPEFV